MVPEDPIITAAQRRLFRRPLEPMLMVRVRIWQARWRAGAPYLPTALGHLIRDRHEA